MGSCLFVLGVFVGLFLDFLRRRGSESCFFFLVIWMSCTSSSHRVNIAVVRDIYSLEVLFHSLRFPVEWEN